MERRMNQASKDPRHEKRKKEKAAARKERSERHQRKVTELLPKITGSVGESPADSLEIPMEERTSATIFPSIVNKQGIRIVRLRFRTPNRIAVIEYRRGFRGKWIIHRKEVRPRRQ